MTSTSGSSGGGSSSSSSSSGSSAPKPRDPREAPAGAYLGTNTNTGGSLVSQGDGTARDTATGQTVSLSPTSGSSSSYGGTSTGGSSTPRSISPTSGGGGGGSSAVDTTVNQKPAENTEGPENTTITTTPRGDFSVVLAGQTQTRPNRSPARSNNFVSLVGGAGGLGRRTSESKRTLIGGA